MKETLSIVSGLLCLMGFVPYVHAILKGTTKPSKASWIIWTTLDMITLAGMYSKDALNGHIVGATTGALVVVGLAMKHGTPGWTKLDKFCFGGALLGIILWQVFSSPVLGIFVSLAIVFLGSIPTFVSAWRDPSREDRLAWTIF